MLMVREELVCTADRCNWITLMETTGTQSWARGAPSESQTIMASEEGRGLEEERGEECSEGRGQPRHMAKGN